MVKNKFIKAITLKQKNKFSTKVTDTQKHDNLKRLSYKKIIERKTYLFVEYVFSLCHAYSPNFHTISLCLSVCLSSRSLCLSVSLLLTFSLCLSVCLSSLSHYLSLSVCVCLLSFSLSVCIFIANFFSLLISLSSSLAALDLLHHHCQHSQTITAWHVLHRNVQISLRLKGREHTHEHLTNSL